MTPPCSQTKAFPSCSQRQPLLPSPETCFPHTRAPGTCETISGSRTEAALKFSESCNAGGLGRTHTLTWSLPKTCVCTHPCLQQEYLLLVASKFPPSPLRKDLLCSCFFLWSLLGVLLGGLVPLLVLEYPVLLLMFLAFQPRPFFY